MKKIKSYNYRLAAASSGSDTNHLFPVAIQTGKDRGVKYLLIKTGKIFTGHCHGVPANSNK